MKQTLTVWPDFCGFKWSVGDQIDRFYCNLIGDLAESEIDKKVDVQWITCKCSEDNVSQPLST